MPRKSTPAKQPGAQVELLPLELIDDPPLPVRETLDEQKLDDLRESISLVGVLNAIRVRRTGKRYQIESGHRRFMAAGMAGLTHIPAVVVVEDDGQLAAALAHENAFREDPNPAEEARWFSVILEKACGGSTDKLADMLKLKRAYIEERLILLRGDPVVLDALGSRQVSMAVARELNRVKSEATRRSLLASAISGGASARVVAQWRENCERTAAPVGVVGAGEDAIAAPITAPAPAMQCILCLGCDQPWDLVMIWVHQSCKRVVPWDRFVTGAQGALVPLASGGADGTPDGA